MIANQIILLVAGAIGLFTLGYSLGSRYVLRAVRDAFNRGYDLGQEHGYDRASVGIARHVPGSMSSLGVGDSGEAP